MPEGLPLFLVRAGQDENPGLNETIDRFMASASTRNLPVALADLPSAQLAGLKIEFVDDVEQVLALVFGEAVAR